MPSQEFWSPTNHQPVAPPKYHKQAGRPKKVRAREKDEPQPPSTLNKLPKCFSKVTCGMCGKKGHNCTTCGKKQRQASQAYGEAGRGQTCGTNEIGHNSPTTKSGQHKQWFLLTYVFVPFKCVLLGLGKRVLDPRVGAGNTGTGRVRAGS
ncbi:unnamed protein product [Malus baccata var. baccata]